MIKGAILIWSYTRFGFVLTHIPSYVVIIHGTGLETNHVRQLVVYILYSAMRVWDYFMYSAISQENQY